LAYLPNPEHPALKAILEGNLNQRVTRIKKFLANLQEDFPELTYELVTDIAQAGSTLGRPDIAAGLVKLGVYGSVDEVFKSGVLSKFSKHYVRNQAPDVLEVIRTVRLAGGVPVIAHPLARTSKEDKQPSNFPKEHFVKMVEAGLLGIETDHLEVPAEVRQVLESFAAEFDLLTTGSSDYHGLGTKVANPLGLRKTRPDQLKRIIELATGTQPLLNHEI
jgi:predicted metal-dependent phosphoesterase TrpH